MAQPSHLQFPCPHRIYRAATFLLVCILWASTTACLRPLDSDFVEQGPGLDDNEMLWIIHVPDGPTLLKDWKPVGDSLNLLRRQDAMFNEAIPALIEDVLNGSLNAYAEYGDVKPIPNLREKFQQFGGSKLNYSPLKRGVEIFSIVQVDEPVYIAKPCYLRLVWKDQGSAQSDRAFAGVYIDSLPREKYRVQTNAGLIPLADYLRIERYQYEPVYVRTNALEYTPHSRTEAIYLRDQVKKGGWRTLEWLEGALNISGKRRILLSPEQMLRFAGSYSLSRTDGSRQQEIFFSPEKDHLRADWEERFELERLFPFHANGFFSTAGDVYIFESGDASQVFIITNGDTLLGTRYEK